MDNKMTVLLDKIRQDYRNGMIREEIAKKYKMSVRAIRSRTSDIKDRKRKKTLYELNKKPFVKLYNQGCSICNIAINLDLKHSTAVYICNRLINERHMQRRSRIDRTSCETKKKINDLYASGISMKKIARKIDVSYNTVWKFLIGDRRNSKDYLGKKNSVLRRTLNGSIHSKRHHYPERFKKNGIDLDYMIKIYHKQGGKCALTGIELIGHTKSLKTASIDRIDNNKGYVKGNVRLTCKFANLAKCDHSDKEFHSFITELVELWRKQ